MMRIGVTNVRWLWRRYYYKTQFIFAKLTFKVITKGNWYPWSSDSNVPCNYQHTYLSSACLSRPLTSHLLLIAARNLTPVHRVCTLSPQVGYPFRVYCMYVCLLTVYSIYKIIQVWSEIKKNITEIGKQGVTELNNII